LLIEHILGSNYTTYYNFIKSIYPLPKKDFELLLGHSKGRQLNAKTILVELGKNPDTMYLLVKGVVRSFFILENGKEITKTLFSDLELCSSFSALIKGKPSEIIYETLTECVILELNYHKFKELCTSNIEILNLYVNYLESHFIKNEEKHLEILSLSATERYLALRKRIPNIDNLIPQYQIAAYLNITPVQLSRIRSSL
jgi:CRP-like cAMP-binding protein